MAATKKKPLSTRVTVTELKEKVSQLESELDKLKTSAYCYLCDKHKTKDKFYVSTDPINQSGVTPICKACATKIATQIDKSNEPHECTKSSVIKALFYLNKPFLSTVWDSSVQESENLNSAKVPSTPFHSYIKNIAMPQYIGLTYHDSDFFTEKIDTSLNNKESSTEHEQHIKNYLSQDTINDYERNKKDVVRLLGYDPFEAELLSDQPFLYAQLLGLLDANGDENDDMMRNASCISIVRGFLQSSKIDNSIAELMADIGSITKNSATIKSLQDSKNKITTMITNLAAESCVSLKNNKNAKKGENTWTGKIKKIKDLDLREGRVNGFDIETAKAMRQVMDSSHHSIMSELKLDDSDWSDMVAEQREMIIRLQKELDICTEISRILLNENLDLKDYLSDNDISPEGYSFVDLDELYSRFSAIDDIKGGDEIK